MKKKDYLKTLNAGLGHMGADLVIDKDRGPLLLKLNARPVLSIQVADQQELRKRLDQVYRTPSEIFAAPEARVAWARDNF